MDRTMFGQWKAEEKELSEKLYLKLNGLALLYTPTEEFKKCLSEEMFLKPNPAAFFQVMHFLFRIYDPNECKKRFYWPLTDKRSEALFRSSAVEYLKQISEKHHLQWNVKSYLVVMPVGIKFINFLMDFIALIVKELTAQREKQLHIEIDADLNLERLLAENRILKELAHKYVTDTHIIINKYTDKILAIREELSKLSESTGIDIEELICEQFLERFEADNVLKFKRKISKGENKLHNLIEPVEALCGVAQKINAKETVVKKPERANLCKVLNKLSEEFMEISAIKNEEEITIGTLITAFNCIQPHIVSLLEETNSVDFDVDFQSEELKKLHKEFTDIEREVLEFKQAVQENKRKEIKTEIENEKEQEEELPVTPLRELNTFDVENRNSNMNSLMLKYVSTPPINIQNEGVVRTRIAFLDDQISNEVENYNQLSIVNRSVRKPSALADKTLNTTINNSLIDAAQMLRSFHQSSKKAPRTKKYEQKLSMLTKWREHEVLFDTLKIDGSLKDTQLSPGNESKLTDSTVIANTRRLSAVRKVQQDSLNMQNMSTSPLGRLESLIGPEETIIKMLPKLSLNDSFCNETQNQAQLCLKDDKDSDNEELFNTSDSVLKDIML